MHVPSICASLATDVSLNLPQGAEVKDLQLDTLQLNTMTLKELNDLKIEIDTAIRASIRKRAEEKSQAGPKASSPERRTIDLERDRDAWLASRGRRS